MGSPAKGGTDLQSKPKIYYPAAVEQAGKHIYNAGISDRESKLAYFALLDFF